MKRRRLRFFRISPIAFAVALTLAADVARGEDLDARKTGPQLFEQTCSACHRSPGGLAKGQNAISLVSFLRQHYTTGPGPAGQLAAYLLANPGDGRRQRPAATNPSAPDRPDQPSAQRQPSQSTEPTEPARPGTRASRRHQGAPPEPPANALSPEVPAERQAAPAAEPTGPGHRGRAQRAARRPGENPAAEPAAAETRRPGEAKPGSPVAETAAQPAVPAAPSEPAVPAASTERPPAAADDQPAFSAPTP
jgi:hypothetical protein